MWGPLAAAFLSFHASALPCFSTLKPSKSPSYPNRPRPPPPSRSLVLSAHASLAPGCASRLTASDIGRAFWSNPLRLSSRRCTSRLLRHDDETAVQSGLRGNIPLRYGAAPGFGPCLWSLSLDLCQRSSGLSEEQIIDIFSSGRTSRQLPSSVRSRDWPAKGIWLRRITPIQVRPGDLLSVALPAPSGWTDTDALSPRHRLGLLGRAKPDDYEIMGRKIRVDFSNEQPTQGDDGNGNGNANANASANANANIYYDQGGQNGHSAPPQQNRGPSRGCPQAKMCLLASSAADEISRILRTLPPTQLLDILGQMKTLAYHGPRARATELLTQAPQLSYAVFQATAADGSGVDRDDQLRCWRLLLAVRLPSRRQRRQCSTHTSELSEPAPHRRACRPPMAAPPPMANAARSRAGRREPRRSHQAGPRGYTQATIDQLPEAEESADHGASRPVWRWDGDDCRFLLCSVGLTASICPRGLYGLGETSKLGAFMEAWA